MTSKEEEEKNSELIARLLMEDQMQDELDADNPYFSSTYSKSSSRSKRSKATSKDSDYMIEDAGDDYLPQMKPKKSPKPISAKKKRDREEPEEGKENEGDGKEKKKKDPQKYRSILIISLVNGMKTKKNYFWKR